MKNPNSLTLGPAIFRNERDQAYSDWSSAFARENLQNAVDAILKAGRTNSGRVNVQIQRLGDDISLIVVGDNGTGMDRHVLENVFLRLGETTKAIGSKDSGGFGRARMMTHFAAHKYAIATRDIRMVGKGGGYMPIRENQPWIDGCEMTFFVQNHGRYTWQKYDWQGVFRSFLAKCQLPCAVYVNGERFTDWMHRRTATRELQLDGKTFATVYANKSAIGEYDSGRLYVRVNGIWMYDTHIDPKVRVIVELDPEQSKLALMSNRDGMHHNYDAVIQEFIRGLNDDAKKALTTRRDRITKVKGTGHFTYSRREEVVALAEAADSNTDASHSVFPDPENISLTRDPMVALGLAPTPSYRPDSPSLPSVTGDTGLRLADIPAANVTIGDLRTTPSHAGVGSSHAADWQEPPHKDWQETREEETHDEEETPAPQQPNKKLVGREERNRLFDVVINDNTDSIDDAALRAKIQRQIRKWHPGNWKVEYRPGQGNVFNGGMRAKLLLLFKTVCHYAVREWQEMTGTDTVEWGVGWYFGDSHAQVYSERKEEGSEEKIHYLLLNPLSDEGGMEYRINSTADWHRLVALAVEQVVGFGDDLSSSQWRASARDLTARILNRLPDIKRALRTVGKVKWT